MNKAWDNVVYTCSTMLIFENENHINTWCNKHRIKKGDIQSLETIWEFSKIRYGNHLNPEWKKWTISEANDIFKRFNLEHDIWKLQISEERF